MIPWPKGIEWTMPHGFERAGILSGGDGRPDIVDWEPTQIESLAEAPDVSCQEPVGADAVPKAPAKAEASSSLATNELNAHQSDSEEQVIAASTQVSAPAPTQLELAPGTITSEVSPNPAQPPIGHPSSGVVPAAG